MKKLWETFGLNLHEGERFGVEIEIEGENLKVAYSDGWDTKYDGSLRPRNDLTKAAEYVFDKPLKLEESKKAIQFLADHLKDSKLDFSFRTSVHVHLNVTDYTEDQLMNLLYTYYLLEEPLMHFCGRDRKSNRFCLRLQDSEDVLEHLNQLAVSINNHFILNDENAKYSSLNIVPVRGFGSVEFRGMRGNLSVTTLHTWIDAINNLSLYARSKSNLLEVFNEFQDLGPHKFLEKVLNNVGQAFVYRSMERDILRSFSLSIDLPHVFRGARRKALENALPKEKAVKKERNPIANPLHEFLVNYANDINPIRHEMFVAQAQPAPRRRAVIQPVMPEPQGIEADMIVMDDLEEDDLIERDLL